MYELKNLNVHRVVESQEEVAKLEAQGFKLVTDKAVPDFSGMKLDELRAYAAGESIDLADATKKDDIIAKLKAAAAPSANK